MLIVCPSCASEYAIDPANLGSEGRRLRCAVCRNAWFAPSLKLKAKAPEPDALAMETLSAILLPPPPCKERRSAVAIRPVAAIMALGLAVSLGSLLVGGVAKVQGGLGKLPQADLSFRNVTSEIAGSDRTRMLVVEGEITNSGREPVPLRPLEFLVRNGDEQVLATWTAAPPRPTLAPGEIARFATRFASPPADGRQVRVHFARAAGVVIVAR